MVTPNNGSIVPLDEETAGAVTAWGRTVFCAPRQLAKFVTRPPEVRDEVIDRLVVNVVRRDVVVKYAATNERRTTRPPVEKQAVDPFRYNDATLRAASEHVVPCGSCDSSGFGRCDTCKASGQVRCPECYGSGKMASPKTGRPINCKVCKKTGHVFCGNCNASGRVTCRGCVGTGHLLAWFALQESERWDLSINPQTPIVVAHGELNCARPLRADSLGQFTIVQDVSTQGPIDITRLGVDERSLITAHRATMDPRLERVRSEQYLRLAVRRRDVTIELGGVSGTIVLSGKTLVGATTPEATRPIKRRNRVWVVSVIALAVLTTILERSFVGHGDYFKDAHARASIYAFVATVLAIPGFGALLRSWRGGFRFHRIPKIATGFLVAVPVLLGAITIDGLLTRPSVSEARAVLATGDVQRAHATAAALHETSEATPDVLDIDDRVALLDAASQHGDEQLKTLDTVAHRKGPAATEAATRARGARLQAIDDALKRNDSVAALKLIESWFNGTGDPEILERQARSHDIAANKCISAPCRFYEASTANKARSIPSRVSAVEVYRKQLLASLDPKVGDQTALVAHLDHVNNVQGVAQETMKLKIGDAELGKAASDALNWASDERAKVPVIGNSLDVAERLLGRTTKLGAQTHVDLLGANAYFSVDANGKCNGVYVAGSSDEHKYTASMSADVVLSQVVGHRATVHPSAKGGSVARWYEAGVPVIARWAGVNLIELRVGNAVP